LNKFPLFWYHWIRHSILSHWSNILTHGPWASNSDHLDFYLNGPSNGSGSAIYGLGSDLEKFPLKRSNFSIFCLRIKKKISSGRVKKYPGQGRVCLLFIAGQKYARAGSGPISTLNHLTWSSWPYGWPNKIYCCNPNQWSMFINLLQSQIHSYCLTCLVFEHLFLCIHYTVSTANSTDWNHKWITIKQQPVYYSGRIRFHEL